MLIEPWITFRAFKRPWYNPNDPNALTLHQNEYIEYQSMINDGIPKRI